MLEKNIDIADNGIAVFDGFFSSELCNLYIEYFEKMQQNGFATDRWTSKPNMTKSLMDDNFIPFHDGAFLSDVELRDCKPMGAFLDIFWQFCYAEYAKKFFVLSGFDTHKIFSIHIQKTQPSQGYHVWHCENSNSKLSKRIMFFILYLNDIEDGGETEFLHLKRRVSPKVGRLLISPVSYTHAHRGNPPLSKDKYIITGWVEF